jgi:hypothetical protein
MCGAPVIAICRGVLLNLLLDFEFEIMKHYVATISGFLRFFNTIPPLLLHTILSFSLTHSVFIQVNAVIQ